MRHGLVRWFPAAVGALMLLAAPLTGQSTVAPGKTTLVTIGTRSGPFPTPYRAQSSNALKINGKLYLFDAGDGAARQLATAGLPIRDIEAIFLTHLHDDHTTGLVPLMSVQYDFDRRASVGIYGPPETGILVRAALQFLTVNSEIRVSEATRAVAIATVYTGHDVAPGVVYKDSNVTVRAVENSHFNFPSGSPAHGKTKSYSYRAETADRSIVFTGDTGRSEALTAFARGADVLVTEVSSFEELKELRTNDGSWDRWTPEQREGWTRHMVDEHVSSEDVGRMASRAAVKAVILTHLPASKNPEDDYARYADIVRRFFTGQVIVARDLGEY